MSECGHEVRLDGGYLQLLCPACELPPGVPEARSSIEFRGAGEVVWEGRGIDGADYRSVGVVLSEKERDEFVAYMRRLEASLTQCWGEAYTGLMEDDGRSPLPYADHARRSFSTIVKIARGPLGR